MYSTNLYCSYVKLALPIREKNPKKATCSMFYRLEK